MEDLAGRVAVVTGAASGIGWALARRFAAAGMQVMLADIEAPRLDERVSELRDAGAKVASLVCDVSSEAAVDELRDRTLTELGGAHLLCNNAGVGGGGLLQTLTEKDWQWVLGVNLWGVIHGIHSFLPHLLEQGEGHIVNTASSAGLVASPFMGPYTASKFAVVGISETLHHELAMSGSGVGVSVLCPGWVATDIGLSARNRPAELTNPPGGTAGGLELGGGEDSPLHAFIQSGKAPEDVADLVHDAVVARRFYVLTHEQTPDAVRRRTDALLAGEDPPFAMPS